MQLGLVNATLAAAVSMPLVWLHPDDEKKTDDKRAEKRVEVKVLRLDAKEDGKPELKIIGGEEGKPHIRIIRSRADSGDKPAGKQPYLGVAIEPVPAALAAHLPGLVSKDQGLLVEEVIDDSPAAKAGLKQHDILVAYDDQKLFSEEQLTKLVRGDKPGREVTLGVIRTGKPEKVKVTIGEHEARAAAFLELPGGKGGHILLDPQGHRKEAFRILKDLDEKAAPGAKAGAQTKSNFSSMRLESLDGDRFKAEIEFKNEKGDATKRSFQGTRDEIRKEIEADKEMPEAIRHQLMRSLDIGKGGKGGFQFSLPNGAFHFDVDSDNFPGFAFPASGDFEQVIELLSKEIDPALREKLKGAFRSIEESGKKPSPRGEL